MSFAKRRISCNSAPCSAPGSPKSRVKFLCSHGGKIFPRPSDGQLKYVGGETRVISVPMDISFQELMKRLTYLIDGEMILKYQLVAEELDALVSVKCDEDVAHMFEEMEHYQVIMGYPRMRTFLFPINHNHVNVMMENPIPLDQRYIFSINGIIFPKHHPTSPSITTKHVASSACTSPRSPDSSATEFVLNMPKIHSSPSICNLPQQSNQLYSYPQYYHNSTTYHAHSSYNSPSLQPFDTHNQRSDRVVSGARFQPDSAPPSYNYAASSRDQNRGGSGYCSNCMHHDSCAHFLDRRRSIDRQGTLP